VRDASEKDSQGVYCNSAVNLSELLIIIFSASIFYIYLAPSGRGTVVSIVSCPEFLLRFIEMLDSLFSIACHYIQCFNILKCLIHCSELLINIFNASIH